MCGAGVFDTAHIIKQKISLLSQEAESSFKPRVCPGEPHPAPLSRCRAPAAAPSFWTSAGNEGFPPVQHAKPRCCPSRKPGLRPPGCSWLPWQHVALLHDAVMGPVVTAMTQPTALGCPPMWPVDTPVSLPQPRDIPAALMWPRDTPVAPTWSRDALAAAAQPRDTPSAPTAQGHPRHLYCLGDTPSAPITKVGALDDARSHGSAQLHLQPLTLPPDRHKFTASSQIVFSWLKAVTKLHFTLENYL